MFKDKLKENRLKLGLTQEQLAGKIFVSREAVSKWEQGRGLPEKESLRHLAELFGMKDEELLNEEDLHQAVDEVAKDDERNRRRLFLLSVISSILVTALASALIAFAFIYHSSSLSEEATYTLSAVRMGQDEEGKAYLESLTATNEKETLVLGKDSFATTAFYNESDEYLEDPWSSIALREGDTFEAESQRIFERNLYGKVRSGTITLKSFHLIAHVVEKSHFLYGVGITLGKTAQFSESGDDSAYLAYNLNEFPAGSHGISIHSHNASEITTTFCSSDVRGKNKVITSYSFILDNAKATNVPFTFVYQNGEGAWSSTFHDVERNVDWKASPTILQEGNMRMTETLKGASDIVNAHWAYNYDDWTISVFFRDDPSRYHVAFYDENNALLKESDVHSTAEAMALSLPEGRAYAMVSEYSSAAKFVSAQSVSKGKNFTFAFSNAFGIFDYYGGNRAL
jgi:transcriptional regulator with XRE-family HTH domain